MDKKKPNISVGADAQSNIHTLQRSPKEIADHIVHTLNYNVSIIKETKKLYNRIPSILTTMESFLKKEQKLLVKNIEATKQGKMNINKLSTLLDEFGYERNDIEEEYLDVYFKIETIIDNIRDPEEREEAQNKIEALDHYYHKIHQDTETIYETYEKLIRTCDR